MGLDGLHISCLRQDFQKFVIRKEKETRKGRTFSCQVVFQRFLNIFKSLIAGLETSQEGRILCHIVNLRVSLEKFHVILPPFVNGLEKFSLLGKLLLNIFSVEDVFKVHPLTLESKPFINHIRNITEMFFP